MCRQDFNYHILRGVIISTTSSAKILKPIDRPDGVDPWDGNLTHQQVFCLSRLPRGLSDSARKERGEKEATP